MYLLHNIVVSIKQLSLVTVLKQCCAYPVPSACGTTGDCASLLIATFPKAVVHGSYWLTVIRYFQMDLCYQLIHSGLRRADQKKKKIPFPQDLTQQYAIWRFCSYQLYVTDGCLNKNLVFIWQLFIIHMYLSSPSPPFCYQTVLLRLFTSYSGVSST